MPFGASALIRACNGGNAMDMHGSFHVLFKMRMREAAHKQEVYSRLTRSGPNCEVDAFFARRIASQSVRTAKPQRLVVLLTCLAYASVN